MRKDTTPQPASRPIRLKGLVLYVGPSRIDSGPIACVMTLDSDNVKTGNMAQTWIFRTDHKPTDSARLGLDRSVCGSCVHLGSESDGMKGRSCYVNLGHGPRGVFQAFQDGRYPVANDRLLYRYLSGHPVRFGAYGDPCAIPFDVWRSLAIISGRWTGYTQRWREPENQAYRSLLMASCNSSSDRAEAKRLGWRTFRDRMADDPAQTGEIMCPASAEGQYRRTCSECLACDGWSRDGQADVTIIGHGNASILGNLNRTLARLRDR